MWSPLGRPGLEDVPPPPVANPSVTLASQSRASFRPPYFCLVILSRRGAHRRSDGPPLRRITSPLGFDWRSRPCAFPEWNVFLQRERRVNDRRGALGPEFVDFVMFLREYYDGRRRRHPPVVERRRLRRGNHSTIPYSGFPSSSMSRDGLTAAEIRPWRLQPREQLRFQDGRLEGFPHGLGFHDGKTACSRKRTHDDQPPRSLSAHTRVHRNIRRRSALGISGRAIGRHGPLGHPGSTCALLGQSKGLVPVRVVNLPMDSVATQRIREGRGMRLELRNTISF